MNYVSSKYEFFAGLVMNAARGAYPELKGFEPIRATIEEYYGKYKNKYFDLPSTVFYRGEFNGKSYHIGVTDEIYDTTYNGEIEEVVYIYDLDCCIIKNIDIASNPILFSRIVYSIISWFTRDEYGSSVLGSLYTTAHIMYNLIRLDMTRMSKEQLKEIGKDQFGYMMEDDAMIDFIREDMKYASVNAPFFPNAYKLDGADERCRIYLKDVNHARKQQEAKDNS